MRPFPESAGGVSDDVVDVTVVEDDGSIRNMIVSVLKRAFSKMRVSELEDVASVQVALNVDKVNRFWLTDLDLNGEPMPVQDLATVLRQTAERTAMVLMSGSDLSEFEALQGDGEDSLKVFSLPKPY